MLDCFSSATADFADNSLASNPSVSVIDFDDDLLDQVVGEKLGERLKYDGQR